MADQGQPQPRLEDSLRAMMLNSIDQSSRQSPSQAHASGNRRQHSVTGHVVSNQQQSGQSIPSSAGLPPVDAEAPTGKQGLRDETRLVLNEGVQPNVVGSVSKGTQLERQRGMGGGRASGRGGQGVGQRGSSEQLNVQTANGRGFPSHNHAPRASQRGHMPQHSRRGVHPNQGRRFQGQPQYAPRRPFTNQSGHMPVQRPQFPSADMLNAQCTFLQHLAIQVLRQSKIQAQELEVKDKFRIELEDICRQLVARESTSPARPVDLVAFGSIASGFATTGSDMDLAFVTSADIPGFFRVLEKKLLDNGIGAHLLTRTRVPIVKICQSPNADLLQALRSERQKWDDMTPEERERHDTSARPPDTLTAQEQAKESNGEQSKENDGSPQAADPPEEAVSNSQHASTTTQSTAETTVEPKAEILEVSANMRDSQAPETKPPPSEDSKVSIEAKRHVTAEEALKEFKSQPQFQKKTWYRQKRLGPLDFPSDGVGVQCDINQANPLGIHNTHLLRCYSHCDPRVQDMIVFVKAWAARRMINSSRNGTLSSYGYVLMVLHFLVNIADPPVCPNLQHWRRTSEHPNQKDPNAYCEGRDVRFWRNENEIRQYAGKKFLTHNSQPLGMLLRNFFFYYGDKSGFIWTQQVLSLRTLRGGLLSKEQKGWTGAKTTILDKNEVRNRYLFAIEDPFELDHNVARTVTHNGIVAIRDEFRRAQRILYAVGRGQPNVEDLMALCDSIQPALEVKALEESSAHTEASQKPVQAAASEDCAPEDISKSDSTNASAPSQPA